ncbi:DUF697 domain-containing protein [Desulfobulbus rhabdoformis]|uniref:DUF697 domain-containing protein n=1 Tax=Desulfobulbus rhabdoformis TaxID=34032 RepID=UPI001963B062|nr:DUF697 domain-containing protein [Desulfobulbus rhabdoformis]
MKTNVYENDNQDEAEDQHPHASVVTPDENVPPSRCADKQHKADQCIKNYVIVAIGLGVLPSALVNTASVIALEVKMIGDLAKIYNFPVPTKLVVYKMLISLAGSLGAVYLTVKFRVAFKGIPLLGHAVYVGTMSVAGGAAMYAVGKIFQEHYESGGTFLSSDNSLLKKFFKEKFDGNYSHPLK